MQSYPKTIWEIFSTANFRCQEKFPQTLYHTTAFGCRVPWKSNLARWHRCRFKREVIIMSVWWLQQMSDDTPNVWLKDFFVCVVFFGSPKFFKQAMVSQLEQLDANFGQRYSKGAWFSISISTISQTLVCSSLIAGFVPGKWLARWFSNPAITTMGCLNLCRMNDGISGPTNLNWWIYWISEASKVWQSN